MDIKKYFENVALDIKEKLKVECEDEFADKVIHKFKIPKNDGNIITTTGLYFLSLGGSFDREVKVIFEFSINGKNHKIEKKLPIPPIHKYVISDFSDEEKEFFILQETFNTLKITPLITHQKQITEHAVEFFKKQIVDIIAKEIIYQKIDNVFEFFIPDVNQKI